MIVQHACLLSYDLLGKNDWRNFFEGYTDWTICTFPFSCTEVKMLSAIISGVIETFICISPLSRGSTILVPLKKICIIKSQRQCAGFNYATIALYCNYTTCYHLNTWYFQEHIISLYILSYFKANSTKCIILSWIIHLATMLLSSQINNICLRVWNSSQVFKFLQLPYISF